MFFLACPVDWAIICRPFNFYWRNDIKGICGNIQQSMLLVAVLNQITRLFTYTATFTVLVEAQDANAPQDRICAIKVVQNFTIREFAKPRAKNQWGTTIFPDAVLTFIEPSLSVINTSIPLFPAVYRRGKSTGGARTGHPQTLKLALADRSRDGKGTNTSSGVPWVNWALVVDTASDANGQRVPQTHRTHLGTVEKFPCRLDHSKDSLLPVIPYHLLLPALLAHTCPPIMRLPSL
ncbi:hypothetical protein K505DRAFT_342620 [Melanomma pulvis-pyrius CBS 109.77]|uniref:Uncharacterized protein n=1 Tax=Melanomma pulvis-pyrius CBS 109.77 TaxID=1314802 RepID=A0A6A6WV74_9PLEO|nr:hypothetical protein K505DRAFT_342620 [Melanomma pulvis-pyrius CBS 109.77]